MSNSGAGWFYAIGQDRHGPVDITALRQLLASGQIYPNTLVWREGMPNWVAAVTHPDLAVAAQQQMQPAAPPIPTPMPGAYVAPGQTLHYYTAGPHVAYGGFWLRFCAAFIDGLILLVPNYLIQFAVRGALGLDLLGRRQGNAAAEVSAYLAVFLLQTALGWLYSALQESSIHQATLGKRACGLIVTDLSGAQISFARATGRYFGKWISGMILLIGFIMAAFTERKQALHDIMAGTLVIKR